MTTIIMQGQTVQKTAKIIVVAAAEAAVFVVVQVEYWTFAHLSVKYLQEASSEHQAQAAFPVQVGQS